MSFGYKDIWGEDPIHPLTAAYQKIAEGIVRMGGEFNNNRRRTHSLEFSTTSARGRGEKG
jgi:hypothetical protein